MVHPDLLGYQNALIQRERQIYGGNAQFKGDQFLLDGRVYGIEKNRTDVARREMFHHFLFMREIQSDNSNVFTYKVLDLGAGIGNEAVGISDILGNLKPDGDIVTITMSNLSEPPGFRLPQMHDNISFESITEVSMELMPSVWREKFDFIYSDEVIIWSKYPTLFIQNIYEALKPGGIAVLISMDIIPHGKISEILSRSRFANTVVRHEATSDEFPKAENIFFLYKSINSEITKPTQPELPTYCRENKLLSRWQDINI